MRDRAGEYSGTSGVSEQDTTAEGICYNRFTSTMAPIPADGRFLRAWVTFYQIPISTDVNKTKEDVGNFLAGCKDVRISTRIIDGRDAVVGAGKNCKDAPEETLASFWLKEGLIRCNIQSTYSWDITQGVLDTIHIIEMTPPPEPVKGGEL